MKGVIDGPSAFSSRLLVVRRNATPAPIPTPPATKPTMARVRAERASSSRSFTLACDSAVHQLDAPSGPAFLQSAFASSTLLLLDSANTVPTPSPTAPTPNATHVSGCGPCAPESAPGGAAGGGPSDGGGATGPGAAPTTGVAAGIGSPVGTSSSVAASL